MHSQSVLCVDDSPTELRLMVKALQGTRLKVLQATDGEVALEMAVEHQPDLILLDIILPKKNGFQVCRQLKRYCHRHQGRRDGGRIQLSCSGSGRNVRA